MTREELIAQADLCDEAREEIADWAGYASEYFQEKHNLVGVLAKWQVRARELRAQAEAMNNGAARQVEQSPGEVAPITGTAGSIPAAAPPSVAQPVAWTMSELCRFFAYAYRAGHDDTCEAVYTHVLECDADTYHQDSVVEYLTDNGMSAAPPDLAARVARLEGLLSRAQPSHSHSIKCRDSNSDENCLRCAIDAALAEGE